MLTEECVELVTASSPSCARFGLSINVLSRTMEMIIIAKCKHSTTVLLVVLHVGWLARVEHGTRGE